MRECKPGESASAGICSARSEALVCKCDRASKYVRWIPFVAWRPYLNESAHSERERVQNVYACILFLCLQVSSINSQSEGTTTMWEIRLLHLHKTTTTMTKGRAREREQQISNWPRLTRQKGERDGTWKVKFEWENISLPCCCRAVSVCLCLYLFWGA